MPSASAIRSRCISAANSACGAPKPRKAPLGGVFVIAARARIRTFGQAYGPPAVDPAARQDHRRQRGVRAGVEDDVDVLGDEPAVAGDARPVTDHRRVPLGRRGDVLVPVVDHPHRSPGLEREERGVDREQRGIVLLAAEPAARLLLDDDDAGAVEAERALQRRVDVVRALERAVDDHPAVVARDRDHRLGLQVQLLLVTGPVGSLEHQVGAREARLQVTLDDLERLAGHRRRERIEHRRQRLGPEADGVPRRPGERAVRRGDQRHRLRHVADLVGDERGLVVRDGRDHVVARDVRRRDDHDAGPVEGGVEVDPEQPRVGLGRRAR